MKTTSDSLKAHDYKKKMRLLSRKSAELKRKYEELNEQINNTLKKCSELLHPQQSKKN
ncbi:hypothetical protein ABDJ41_05455 [Pedobacter sp. ASV1-7]|uniref:hypothetical protein n=1 Tax=Pedobacter sp. ASV1-7 TaxID=3145237 RepID=UPI0032E870BF